METPNFPPPRDAAEQQVLAKLSMIRDQLQLLKHDRRTYMQRQDIVPLYEDTLEQVKILNDARASNPPVEKNRVDRVMDSCFLLLSLCYMTIGQNNTAPAAYALIATIERLLVHLTEVDLYSAKDLESISETLCNLSRNMKNAPPDQSPYLTVLLQTRLTRCKESLDNLQKRLARLEDPLPELHEKLISILRSISLANTRSKFSASEVKSLRAKAVEIETKFKNREIVNAEGNYPAGSDDVDFLLRKCVLWSDIVLERRGVIPEPYKEMYGSLTRIRNNLEKLSITGKWALREADLYDYQKELDRIDEMRVNGNWSDEEGTPAELYVQRTLLYLVRRSYGYIYFLMISSNPVSEALQPVYNQLQTLKRCLIEVKENGGVSSVRELYPYSMKLNSIDNMRVEGKFMFNGDIPEGQGSVNELLAECFEINYELRIKAEQEDSEDEDEDADAESKLRSDAQTEEEVEALANSVAEAKLEQTNAETKTPA